MLVFWTLLIKKPHGKKYSQVVRSVIIIQAAIMIKAFNCLQISIIRKMLWHVFKQKIKTLQKIIKIKW